MTQTMTDDEEIELMRQLIAKHPGPASKIFATGLKSKPVPTLQDLKPEVIDLAQANPTKTIMVVSSDLKTGKTPNDPDYQLIPIYASPIVHTREDNLSEFYQVYVLKR